MKSKFLSFLLILSVLFAACDKDDPDIIDEPEVITTMDLLLIPSNGGDNITLSFRDLDGPGGNDATITGGNLKDNTTYIGTITLLNESVTPTEDISEEVLEEGVDHQFFFSSTLSDVSFQYSDTDDNGDPIGLEMTVQTGSTGTGTLKVILRHEPEKDATGVASGDITNAGGETDIEVDFPIVIE